MDWLNCSLSEKATDRQKDKQTDTQKSSFTLMQTENLKTDTEKETQTKNNAWTVFSVYCSGKFRK